MSPVGPIFQAIFTVPATIIETIMTCKMFRAMILRSFDIHSQNSTSGDLAGAPTQDDETVIELNMSLDLERLQMRMVGIERERV